MKIRNKVFIIVLCMLLTSSCVRQRYIGQNDFAIKFNKCPQSVKLDESGYYEKGGEFNFFAKSDNLRQILISLKQNDKGFVTCAELTVTKNSKNLGDTEKAELLKTVSAVLSVLLNCEEEVCSGELSKINFDKSKFEFSNNTESFEISGADCFFNTNGEMIFFRVEIK